MDLLLLGALVLRVVNWIYAKITSLFPHKRKCVPPISEDYKYLFISATNLAEKIRNEQIKSEDVVNEYITRIKEVNPIINAIFEERFTAALQEAVNIETILKNTTNKDDLKTSKPLLGVPITIKESCVVKGMSLTGGSLFRKGEKADKDSVVVERLKNAGAIILLVSATPEYCLSFETNTLLNGVTNNPYDTTKVAGGSSGGEGALLGAGASLIGIGSDIAGSIRIPAFFNGIFGHKATKRLVYSEDHFIRPDDKRASDYLTMGPMTRYAEDLRLLMTIICPEQVDTFKLNEKVSLKDIQIFTMEQCDNSQMLPPVQQEIKQAIRQAENYLQNNGCKLRDYKFDLRKTTHMASSVFYDIKGIPNLFKHEDREDNLYTEVLKSIFGMSKYSFNFLFFEFLLQMNGFVPISEYPYYSKKANALYKTFEEVLGNNGVLLYPTFPRSAFPHNHSSLNIVCVGYPMLFNVLGLPCCNVPMGFDKKGLPIGIQVVAGPNQDRLCFAIAEELQKGFGGWKQAVN